MARHDSDREDLLREATALVERIELALVDDPNTDHVIIGFRANGAASFFFGDEPVYQFNTAGQLRRAYRNSELFKAEGGRLVALRRLRQQGEVQLRRREITEAEQRQFIDLMTSNLTGLARQLEESRYHIVGQISSGIDVLSRVKQWLATNDFRTIAAAPNVNV